jgi:hypothetical protein
MISLNYYYKILLVIIGLLLINNNNFVASADVARPGSTRPGSTVSTRPGSNTKSNNILDKLNIPKFPGTKRNPIIVLVTGANSGIGKAAVLQFATDNRFRVYASMRSINKWTEGDKDNIIIEECDVTSSSSVENLFNKIMSKETKIDIVVNSAGYGLAGTVEAVTIDEAKDLFDVNLWGVVRIVQGIHHN